MFFIKVNEDPEKENLHYAYENIPQKQNNDDFKSFLQTSELTYARWTYPARHKGELEQYNRTYYYALQTAFTNQAKLAQFSIFIFEDFTNGNRKA